MDDTRAIPPSVRHLATEIAEPRPMRRGSLSERFVKCSKPDCPCGEQAPARHGPYFSITRGVEGRTRSRFIPSDKVALVRQQIDSGRRFREQIEAYWQACERWADAQLEEAPAEEAQKGGSKKPSRPRRSKRSKPS